MTSPHEGSGAENAEGTPALPRLATPESFPFPYPTPYGIQLDLMRTVFAALEDRKIAIVGSVHSLTAGRVPHGYRKVAHAAHRDAELARRAQEAARLGGRGGHPGEVRGGRSRWWVFMCCTNPDPAWLIDKAVARHMGELRRGEEERSTRLAAARERERRARAAGSTGAFRGPGKRAKVDKPEGSAKPEEDFLPEDAEREYDDGLGLSAEVRELMAKLESRDQREEEVDEEVPKVYYASRTHSQLRQLTAELLKTTFAGEESVSLVPLASRKQMCINDKVRALAGEERMNEACLDMQKSGGSVSLANRQERSGVPISRQRRTRGRFWMHETECSPQ